MHVARGVSIKTIWEDGMSSPYSDGADHDSDAFLARKVALIVVVYHSVVGHRKGWANVEY